MTNIESPVQSFADALPLLERLREVVERRMKIEKESPDAHRSADEIPIAYGAVEEVYRQVAGDRQVELQDRGHNKIFVNFFEAGWLSGRTFHRTDGYKELLKVVGRVRAEVEREYKAGTLESPPSTDLSRLTFFRDAGRQFLDAPDGKATHIAFSLWVRDVEKWLDHIAPESGLSREWSSMRLSRLDLEHRDWPRAELIAEFREIVRERVMFLIRLPERIDNPPRRTQTKRDKSKVFIVHGHHTELREATCRVLAEQGLNVVVLSEQPNKGRTIIEKIEENTDAGFAVVLLTADDLGKSKSNPELSCRARQNVVFELGYFIGVLGRDKVCCVYEEGVELPSDYHGVVYIPLSSGDTWKISVLKELAAAGISVDLNRLNSGSKPEQR